MTKAIVTRFGAALSTIATLGIASQSSAEPLFEACASDLEQFCSSVEPGHGRLMACLYAHELEISDRCDVATGEMGDLLDVFFDRVRYVKQECGDDIRSLCSEVAVGEGRVFACLRENESEVSQSCQGVIDQVSLPSD